ncbi:hypothetical protein TorRG33x02_150710 [Trema orientale]|uniref:Uncharacterized protein n=1 Tax=Trema orientale TaxID=63057 RepID=A0A2P5EUI8_TREOI|nr:hypothetical protein TorRG33x02_150710 [Trema orientale]
MGLGNRFSGKGPCSHCFVIEAATNEAVAAIIFGAVDDCISYLRKKNRVEKSLQNRRVVEVEVVVGTLLRRASEPRQDITF